MKKCLKAETCSAPADVQLITSLLIAYQLNSWDVMLATHFPSICFEVKSEWISVSFPFVPSWCVQGQFLSVLFRRKLYQLIAYMLSLYIVSQTIDPLKHEIHLNKVGTFHFCIHTSQGHCISLTKSIWLILCSYIIALCCQKLKKQIWSGSSIFFNVKCVLCTV